MKVFLLTSHPVNPPWNSGDKHLARQLLLRDAGVEHYFFTQDSDQTVWPSSAHRVPVSLHTDVPTSVAKLRMYSSLVSRVPAVDVVHSLVAYRRGTLTQRAMAATPLMRRARLIVTCPTGWSLPEILLRRADVVVAVSQRTTERLRHLGQETVLHIPPGVDLDAFRPSAGDQARARLGLPEGPPVILFAGHYAPGGGLDACLRVVTRLRRRMDVRVVLAMRPLSRSAGGSGDQTRALERRLEHLGLAGAATILGRTADMRSAILAASAVLFQPDDLHLKTELPITLLEALSSGRPLVISRAPPLPELDDGTGAVTALESRDDVGTAAALERLFGDPDRLAACSHAARTLAVARYDAKQMVASYADLYRTLDDSVASRQRRSRSPRLAPERAATVSGSRLDQVAAMTRRLGAVHSLTPVGSPMRLLVTATRKAILAAYRPADQDHSITTVVPLGDGLSIRVNAYDRIQRELYLVDYEPDIRSLIRELLRPGQSVIDVGANIGIHTLVMARAVGDGIVVACEPNPRIAAELAENVAANMLANVAIARVAVTAAPGRFALHVPSDVQHVGGATLIDHVHQHVDQARAVTVEGITLDALADRYGLAHVGLVKIDVEGYEGSVLEGGSRLLQQWRPALIFEYTRPWWERNGYSLDRVQSRLRDLGYFRFETVTWRGLQPVRPGLARANILVRAD